MPGFDSKIRKVFSFTNADLLGLDLNHVLLVFYSRDWNHLAIGSCEDPFLCHSQIFQK